MITVIQPNKIMANFHINSLCQTKPFTYSMMVAKEISAINT